MSKQVISRDRQELQAADLNHIGDYAKADIEQLTRDSVSNALHYAGGSVTTISTTEASIAPFRLYKEGAAYEQDTANTLDLFTHLPLVTQRCVAITVWGESVETDIEPRDFLIDLTTNETQPDAVAMTRLNKANVNMVPGSESADPQPPTAQQQTLVVALVYLTTGGIDRIEMQTQHLLPNALTAQTRVGKLEVWRKQAEPAISSIATDLASLSMKTNGLAKHHQVVEMAGDIARLKNKLNLPSGLSSYQNDYFLDDLLTDSGAVGFNADVDNGLLFAPDATAAIGMALFNPFEPAVHRTDNNVVLPKYVDKARIQTLGYAGDISISQYQTQTQVLKEYTVPVTRYNYGWRHNYWGGWYSNYWYNRNYHYGYYGWGYGYYGYAHTTYETRYKLETVTNSINGAIIAQTFLVSNSMWLTQCGLQFTQVGATGDVNLIICEADGGKPNLEKTLAQVTVSQADLHKYPVETNVPIPPVLLESGKRYAIAIITQGDHRCATVSGSNYTQGTLFFGTDGEYFQGDLTKDLMFTLYAAQFNQARVEVPLQSISLAGGISDLALDVAQVVPDGTELFFEMQVGGKWLKLGEQDSAHLQTTPDIIPLRAVFMGTHDLAPMLTLTNNAITGSRPDNALVHWSTTRTLPAPSSNIQIQLVVAKWDDINHSLTAELHENGNTHLPATSTLVEEPEGGLFRLTLSFTPTAISSYAVKTIGQRNTANPFSILERTDVAL